MTRQYAPADSGRWDIIITPRKGWFDLDLAGLWRYRDLVVLLFKRDFVALYKQTILGPLWYFVQPILTTVAFVFIFNRVARIPTDEVPPFLFYLGGVVIWSFFAACFTRISETFVSNAAIFSKVYFPRLVVPVSVVLSSLLAFSVQLVLLLASMIYFWIGGSIPAFGLRVLGVVPVVAYVGFLGLGVGIIVSSLTTRFRDLAYVVGFATQLWMYMTPVVYPLSEIPERWLWVFYMNPMTAPVETFRALVLGAGSPSPGLWASGIALTCVIVISGLGLFSRIEKRSMDTV